MVFAFEPRQGVQREGLHHRREDQSLKEQFFRKRERYRVFRENAFYKVVEVVGDGAAEDQSEISDEFDFVDLA